jgi:hypothetical protein
LNTFRHSATSEKKPSMDKKGHIPHEAYGHVSTVEADASWSATAALAMGAADPVAELGRFGADHRSHSGPKFRKSDEQ